jgi:hypothetical protein
LRHARLLMHRCVPVRLMFDGADETYPENFF